MPDSHLPVFITNQQNMNQKRIYRKAQIEGHNQMRMQQIGYLLREYRYETMLSRADFEKLGMSRSVIERIETGKIVTTNSLFRYMDLLLVSPEDIFLEVE